MKVILLFILNTYCILASAAIFYVSPSGSDSNPGTLEAPWITWQKAVASRSPGDTVYFRGGVYYTTARVEPTNSGTAGNYICYFAYPGEKPILDAVNRTTPSQGITTTASYLHFRGLTVRNNYQITYNYGAAVGFNFANSENIILENCVTHDNGYRGFAFYSVGGKIQVINCDSYNNVDSLSVTPGNAGDGYIVMGTNTPEDTIIFRGCRSWHNSDDGWDVHTAAYIELDSCWAINNGAYPEYNYGNGFKIGLYNTFESRSTLRKVTNCIAVYNRGNGIGTNDRNSVHPFSMNIFNNTSCFNGLYGTSGSGYSIMKTTDTEAAELRRIFKNNLAYGNTNSQIYVDGDASYTHSNNSWDILGLAIQASDFVSLDSIGIIAPRQAEGLLPDNDFYKYFLKLSNNSQAIDKGIDVGLTYNGSFPDLGWAEFNSGKITTPSVPLYISSSIENSNTSLLEMSYSMDLANITPPPDAFIVNVNSSIRSVNSVSISGKKVYLTLTTPVTSGDIVTVAYTKSVINPLQTIAGGQAPTITAQVVTNNCTLVSNTPPVVSITSPGKSSSFNSPATIYFEAIAYDPDGTISLVEFYNGPAKLGEIKQVPYYFVWKEVPAGTYSIKAISTDNLNAKTTSESITIVVTNLTTTLNQLPIVSINTPLNKSNFEIPGTVSLTSDAYDHDGTINKVEYFNSKLKIGESFTTPFEVMFEITEVGSYEITAIATDNLNAIASSAPIIINASLRTVGLELVNLYPNPNNGQFTINISSLIMSENKLFTIISSTGKVIFNETMPGEEKITQFDFENLAPGMYVLIITGNEIIYTKKFLKI